MRVYDQNLTGSSASQMGRAQQTERTDRSGGSEASSVPPGGDHVEFSRALGSLARAQTAAQSDRAARVQQLAAEYQGGRYLPDAAATGRAMVADALAGATGQNW
jgi:hypothetical protein